MAETDRTEPFAALQRIHDWAHAKNDLHGTVGMISQLFVIVFAVIISKLIR